MNDYLVSWEIELRAESPKAAAQKAWKIIHAADSSANVFTVHGGEQEEPTQIDLEEEE